jgi:hypothetical protein
MCSVPLGRWHHASEQSISLMPALTSDHDGSSLRMWAQVTAVHCGKGMLVELWPRSSQPRLEHLVFETLGLFWRKGT